jgi:septum site-determining protein MinD
MSEVIGIVASKGGVGKTTCTASLSCAISSLGYNVLAIDANFSAPNLGIHFGIIDPETTLHDVLLSKKDIFSSVYKINDNLYVMPSELMGRRVDHRKLRKKIPRLKKFFDYILIDSSPETNREMLATLGSSNKVVVISTPDIPTLSLTMSVIKQAKKCKTDVKGIILNMVNGKKFELKSEEFENACKIPVIGIIKQNLHFKRALSKNKTIGKFRKWSSSSREFTKIAKSLTGEDKGWW